MPLIEAREFLLDDSGILEICYEQSGKIELKDKNIAREQKEKKGSSRFKPTLSKIN